MEIPLKCLKYQCSFSGMYMFTWHHRVRNDYRFFSDMYMNEDLIATNWSYGPSGAMSSSQLVFIQCESGSRVYVQCGSDHSCVTHDLGLKVQSFSGFLVMANDDF